MKITVPVTQEHIDSGKPGECGKCPVAKALNDRIGGAWIANCMGISGDFDGGASVDIHSIPKKVRSFVAMFDCGGTVKPFEFELDLDARDVATVDKWRAHNRWPKIEAELEVEA